MVAKPDPTPVFSGVRQPGLWRLDPYLERYKVSGGGTAIFTLHEGDHLAVSDLEGRQPAEVVAFGADGKPDPSALTSAKPQPAEGLKAILSGTEQSADGQVQTDHEQLLAALSGA